MTDYDENGFVLLRSLLDHQSLDNLLNKFVSLVNSMAGTSFTDAHDPAFAQLMYNDSALQARAYDAVRNPPWLEDLAKHPKLVDAIQKILGPDIATMGKIPFRIDVPMELKELAVWHQDYWYVKGNTDIITAWIPMQDTAYVHGALTVMPGSHKLGPVEHDVTILGKRHSPARHLDREIRLVEMKKGDVLLFHSCLLHSGNINMSPSIRYSIQARYSAADKPTDPGMGKVIRL